MSDSSLSRTPAPPYYAAIFTSQRTTGDEGYAAMARRMEELAAQQPGFLAVDSVRNSEGLGLTVSYWRDLESIAQWKRNGEHLEAQQAGRKQWYAEFIVRIAHVEREYSL
jgi:heme-degrading monooxygenase HmoA